MSRIVPGILIALLVIIGVFVSTAQTPARTFTPVTQKMLENPSPDDWLMFSRTYDAQRFSPLKQINKQNVGQLRARLGSGVWRRPNRNHSDRARWCDVYPRSRSDCEGDGCRDRSHNLGVQTSRGNERCESGPGESARHLPGRYPLHGSRQPRCRHRCSDRTNALGNESRYSRQHVWCDCR